MNIISHRPCLYLGSLRIDIFDLHTSKADTDLGHLTLCTLGGAVVGKDGKYSKRKFAVNRDP